MSALVCPHCGQSFEASDAFRHEIELAEKAKFQKKLDEAATAELALRKQKAELEERQRNFELEKQRQLDAEREAIRQKTIQEDTDKFRLKEKEYQKVIEDLKLANEDSLRKATQGSQQLQGEILELDLEQSFKQTFPQDRIEPVAKGTLGADIKQIVISPKGTDCGAILWEIKRTKAWSPSWLTKLKTDLVSSSSHIPALVSEVLPDTVKQGLGYIDGVWVCLPPLAISLSMLLRKSLLDVARQKVIAANQDIKSRELYEYVTSPEFANQAKLILDTYYEMKMQVAKEKAALEKNLKYREAQIDKLISGMSNVLGSMQSVANLPTSTNLELPSD